MPRKLLVVESPNKVAKIRDILDRFEPRQWRVVATAGHWRGLPPMDRQSFEETVSPTRDFEERFAVLKGKEDIVARLKSAIAQADEVYLGSDGDHEGEAIAWHVATHFALKSPKRVIANEITTKGITRAVTNPTNIDAGVVQAQRARAVVDYLIGMEVSRLLWRFGAKSAGRLQSCALHILAERERAIRAFKSTPFWTLAVQYKEAFTATVGEVVAAESHDGEESGAGEGTVKPKRFATEAEAASLSERLEAVEHVVEAVVSKPGVRRPPPPFTTSSLLASASRELGFPVEKTTQLAQRLFEAGAVTYIRTDSTALADDAVLEIRSYLGAHHPELLPAEAVKARQGTHAQAAHEAIRPTHMTRLIEGLSADEDALYRLIFDRTLACQAKPARTEARTVTVRPKGMDVSLVAHEVVLVEPGWEGLGEKRRAERGTLPELSAGQGLSVHKASVEQGRTKAAPRFTEESLVRYLEQRGVGRPSTYAPMLATLKARGYVRIEKRMLLPEDLGMLADELVVLGFPEVADENFTARTESALSLIATGKLGRPEFLGKYYAHFQRVKTAAVSSYAAFAAQHPERDRERVVDHDAPCPGCGGRMQVRTGERGRYARCVKAECGRVVDLEPPTYHRYPCPSCGGKVVERVSRHDGKRQRVYKCLAESCGWRSTKPPPKSAKAPCPSCGSRMVLRAGKDGTKFWGCSRFPECRNTVAYETTGRRKRVGS